MPGGVQLLPMTGGEIVLAYNLPGNPKLKLPRDVYAGIFLGKITKWSDPKLKAANPGRDAAGPGHHGRAARGRQRNHLRLHHAPERHRRGVEARPGCRDHGELAQERQVRGLAEERRRERDHQADAGRDRISRVRVREVRQARDRPAAEQDRTVRERRGRGRSGCAGRRPAAGRPPGVGDRSRRAQGVPHRDLHLDAVLQGEQGCQEGRRPPRDGRVLSERRPEDERPDGLHRAARQRGSRRAKGGGRPFSECPGAARGPATTADRVSGPPSRWDYFADRTFRLLAQAGVWFVLLLLAFILWEIGGKASRRHPGLRPRLPDLDHVGRRAPAVRHPAAHLGHALQLGCWRWRSAGSSAS